MSSPIFLLETPSAANRSFISLNILFNVSVVASSEKVTFLSVTIIFLASILA